MNEIKVQLVEDEAFTAEYIKEMLTHLGYRVSSVVDSGHKAIEAAGKDRPDIILMDIFLEGDIDGIETAKQIHSQYEIPVIFITAQDDPEVLQRAKEANSYGFLIKAFEERDLRVSIEMALHAAYADAGRKKAEKALRQSELRLNGFLDSATDMFFLFDANLHLVMVNTAGLALFPPGTMKQDIVGLSIEDLLPADFQSGRIEHFKEVIRSGGPHFSGDIPALSLLGNTYINIKAFKTGDGLGMIVRDITKRQLAETEKKKLEALLLRTQKIETVSALSEGIARDFNNLLHVIGGNAELLLENARKKDKTALNDIMDSVRKGAELIRRLLALSRQDETDSAIVNLNDEIDRMKHLLDRLMPKMIDIQIQLDPDIPGICCIPARMEQVLMELCINAKNAMPDGGRLIIATENRLIKQTETDAVDNGLRIPSGRYVFVTIADTGSGIDPAIVNRAFDPDLPLKDRNAKTNVGLAFVHDTIRSFNGFISCNSDPERGTTFSIYLPMAEIKGDAEPSASQDFSEPAAEMGQGAILVVDDEKDVLNLTGAMLERLGYRFVAADSGESALEIYLDRMNEIDMVLLDLNMPGMGGRRCLERIRMINPSARVVITSGHLKEGLMKALIGEGAGACLIKPYSRLELSRAIYSVLKNTRQV